MQTIEAKVCGILNLAQAILYPSLTVLFLLFITQLVVDHLVPLGPHQHTLVDVVW